MPKEKRCVFSYCLYNAFVLTNVQKKSVPKTTWYTLFYLNPYGRLRAAEWLPENCQDLLPLYLPYSPTTFAQWDWHPCLGKTHRLLFFDKQTECWYPCPNRWNNRTRLRPIAFSSIRARWLHVFSHTISRSRASRTF